MGKKWAEMSLAFVSGSNVKRNQLNLSRLALLL